MYLKKTLLILFILSNCIKSFSQQTASEKLDSLQAIIDTSSTYTQILSEYSEIANVYEYEGNWKEYNIIINKMIDIAKKNNDIDYEAECYNKWGISNCYQGNNSKAIEYFEKALKINLESNDSNSISNSYENISLVYKDMAIFDKAIDYQLKSIKLREKLNHPRLINNYANLATIFKLMEDWDKESFYIHKAHEMLINSGKDNPSTKAIIYNQLGSYYSRIEKPDSAIFCYDKVIEYSKIAGWKRGIAVGLGNKAEVYQEIEEIDKAINIHHEVLELSYELDDCMSIVEELTYLGNLYMYEDMLDSAKYYAKKGLDRAYNCNLGKDKMNILILYSDILEQLGNFKESLYYYKKYHDLSDSLFNSEKQSIVSELETQFQTEKKEQEIKQLSAENEASSQKIKFAIAGIIAILLAAGFIISIMILRRRKAQTEQEKLKQQLFRSQMNPHFIFNALASIQNFMYGNQLKLAAQYLGNFSSLTRSVLINSTKETISLEDKIESLINYIELEKMRLKNSFSYEINFDEDLETEFIFIPPMLLQPFIENAIKHGLKSVKENGLLKINLTDNTNTLKVEIEDNGIGINKANKENKKGHKSMAIDIFNQRMQIIKKNTKNGLKEPEIIDLSTLGKKGTLVELSLPILN